MKKLFFSILMLTSILFVGCTDLDDVNERLDDHDNRLNAIESLINDANNEITSIKALLDAQSKKISIVSYTELADKSGYELVMSDGSKITLKNGKEGSTPIVNVKMHTDGNLYWTIDGEFMRDADGNMIKADGQDGQDGQDGITPKLRVNTDSFWEVSLDNGKTWQLMLDVNGDPISAKGSDATVDLKITETDEAIIIEYDGQTYIIPKNNDVAEVLFKVGVPTIDDFNQSYILKVLNVNNEQIAEICLEYIKSENVAKRMMTLYLSKDNEIDINTATTLEDGGKLDWDIEKFSCVYTPGSESDLKEVYISPNGLVSFSNANSADILETSLEAYLITDQRNDELNTYSVTKIGTQYWMAENLKTLYYADKTPIRTGLDKEGWLENTEGAVAIYEDEAENLQTMGALYNWHAVNNEKGLAPEGYRISSDEDWAVMAYYLDPENYGVDETGIRESETIAPLLKSTEGWHDNQNGNNLTGFNAYAYGSTSESKYMDYSGKGRQAYFWTTQQYEDKTAIFRRIYWDENFTNRWYEGKTYGYSVRCVRN